MRFLGRSLVLLLAFAGAASGDAIDAQSAARSKLDELALDLHGGRWTAQSWAASRGCWQAFGALLQAPEARSLWDRALPDPGGSTIEAARGIGALHARMQHAAALEMIFRLNAGDIEGAREWRSIIDIPKYASAVEGALALQRMGGEATHREAVATLLAREYITWQATRVRQKADQLSRLVASGRSTPELVGARASEIQILSEIPSPLLGSASRGAQQNVEASRSACEALLSKTSAPASAEAVSEWRLAVESSLPNLLTDEDVSRRERIVLKLLRLIPMEYQGGVRDGQITVPIEYREAQSFTVQVQQILSELLPTWRQTKGAALDRHGEDLRDRVNTLESAIASRVEFAKVDELARTTASLLQTEFKLSAKRSGKASDVVAETVLEVRSLLSQSLLAARAGQWKKAESLRLDAYINFDLEIERRALPRDPELAARAERAFLDGSSGAPGIKAALDARAKGADLDSAYQRALDGMDECAALLRVGLSPAAAIASAAVIVTREGLEAVVILAALLAGLRGEENRRIRKRVAGGAWIALAASGGLFLISQHLLSGLSRYGELLEAVISIIAVVILLIVTNWVFHKMYWVEWNARLREMSKAARARRSRRAETLALLGVGFMTIFREGFETTLFMQSLILEAGMKAALTGLAIGGTLIAAMGLAVFAVGARLPYRKLLVYTGLLVILVLVTFVGSTVRLFQTVGWMPVHPVPGLELPAWTGLWLGVYPTWEGLLLPVGSIVYVGGMWLWVKVTAMRARAAAAEAPSVSLHSASA